MGAEEGVAEDHAAVAGQELAGADHVADGLGHLLALELKEGVVEPVAGERLAGGGLGLGDLVLVVGEDEVLAAAVDVEGAAQVLAGHGRALDVPAGAARAPGRVPGGLAGLGALPEGEVQRVALVRVDLDPGAGLELGQVAAGQPAVLGPLADGEVDVAADLVGDAGVDQAGDQGQHLRDVAAGPWRDVGRLHAEGGGDLVVDPGPVLGHDEGPERVVAGGVDDLVVDVGVVADVEDVVAGGGQVAAEDVEHDHRAEVADVGLGVDGGAAEVDPDPALVAGHERLLATGQGVVELEGHGGSAPGSRSAGELRILPANRLLSGQADRAGGDPLAPAGEAEAVGGLGRDPDPGRLQAEGGGQVGGHGGREVAEAGPVAEHGHVQVDRRPAAGRDQLGHPGAQVDAGDALPARVGRGEVVAEVGQPGRAEHGVAGRVGDHVGVGVAVQAELERDGHPAEDQRPPGHQRVRVHSLPDPQRREGHEIPRAPPPEPRRRARRVSAMARSSGVVTFRFSGSPGTTWTGWPASSTRAASSAASTPSRRASR